MVLWFSYGFVAYTATWRHLFQWWLSFLAQLPYFRNMKGCMSHSRENIFTTPFIIIIKSEISTFPIAVIFPWLCAWGNLPSYAVGFIYIPENWVLCLLLFCSRRMCANNRVHYDLIVAFVCLHIALFDYHQYADFFWRYWTSKTLVMYILFRVYV